MQGGQLYSHYQSWPKTILITILPISMITCSNTVIIISIIIILIIMIMQQVISGHEQ